MLLRTHLVISLFFALIFSAYLPQKAGFISLVLLATAVVDIDNAKSMISRNFRFLSRLIRFFVKHRGFFHSLTFAIILALIVSSFSRWAGLAVFLGYSLHLLADSFTRQGIQVFWPFPPVLKGRIKTSGIAEKAIFWLFAALSIAYLTSLFT